LCDDDVDAGIDLPGAPALAGAASAVTSESTARA